MGESRRERKDREAQELQANLDRAAEKATQHRRVRGKEREAAATEQPDDTPRPGSA